VTVLLGIVLPVTKRSALTLQAAHSWPCTAAPLQEAATLALRCVESAQDKGAGRAAATRIAAKVLTRRAIDLGTRDNVTLVVVDLTQQ
jgi:hypothetical protein